MDVTWGISALFHDAALSVVSNNKILFASSAERFSRLKNDSNLNKELIDYALQFGVPSDIVWYENTFKRSLRYLLKDRRIKFFNINKYLKSFNINAKITYGIHHKSHLLSSLFTSPFHSDCLGVVVDSVGEFDSLSVWDIQNKDSITKIYSHTYPDSLGLFYSSVTDLVGLKPQEDEYILMGMASYGKTDYYYNFFKQFFYEEHCLIDCRKGIRGLLTEREIHNNKFDIALGAQKLYEEILLRIVRKFIRRTGYNKVILSGGCALNCKANTLLLNDAHVHIFPNPGDAGSALGCCLNDHADVHNMFLGYDAGNVEDLNSIVNVLLTEGVIGIVNGRAEFGPRALGNRSILADPRRRNIQDKVNNMKGRELFRPFAPAILKEFVHEYFDTKDWNPDNFKYMQYVLRCMKPSDIPGVVHVDGTSRVQAVDDTNPFLYSLLKIWKDRTGCPVLLNTSLNKKGKPLINTIDNLMEFVNRDFKVATCRGII